MREFIAYYRVSTKMQGADGLGMEAQRTAVTRYADATGSTNYKASVATNLDRGVDCSRPAGLRAVLFALSASSDALPRDRAAPIDAALKN